MDWGKDGTFLQVQVEFRENHFGEASRWYKKARGDVK